MRKCKRQRKGEERREKERTRGKNGIVEEHTLEAAGQCRAGLSANPFAFLGEGEGPFTRSLYFVLFPSDGGGVHPLNPSTNGTFKIELQGL